MRGATVLQRRSRGSGMDHTHIHTHTHTRTCGLKTPGMALVETRWCSVWAMRSNSSCAFAASAAACRYTCQHNGAKCDVQIHKTVVVVVVYIKSHLHLFVKFALQNQPERLALRMDRRNVRLARMEVVLVAPALVSAEHALQVGR